MAKVALIGFETERLGERTDVVNAYCVKSVSRVYFSPGEIAEHRNLA